MSDLTGIYHDPNHGHCLRVIKPTDDGSFMIYGTYGNDEAAKAGTQWRARASMEKKSVYVDFFEKHVTHARVLQALWCPNVRELHWEDGNIWKKLYSHHDCD